MPFWIVNSHRRVTTIPGTINFTHYRICTMGNIRISAHLLQLASSRNSQSLRPRSSGTQRFPQRSTSRSTSSHHLLILPHPFVSLSPSYSPSFITVNIPAQWARAFAIVDHRDVWRGRVSVNLFKGCARIRRDGMATEGSEESDGRETILNSST